MSSLPRLRLRLLRCFIAQLFARRGGAFVMLGDGAYRKERLFSLIQPKNLDSLLGRSRWLCLLGGFLMGLVCLDLIQSRRICILWGWR